MNRRNQSDKVSFLNNFLAGGPPSELPTPQQERVPRSSRSLRRAGSTEERTPKSARYRQHQYPPLQKPQGRGTHSF